MHSMTLLTILQTLWVFIAYSLTIFVFPGLVFGKRFAGYSLSKRFLFYFVIGNFYMINMVLLLAVFRIAYAPVMIAVTVLFVVVGRIIVNRVPVRKRLSEFFESFRRLTRGSLGSKSATFQIGAVFARIIAGLAAWFRDNFLKKIIDWVLIAGVIASLAYIYGTNLVKYYGYAASDTLVHNIWINYMSHNQVFASGVYPYGFHAIIYFIHKVFFLENYVILRVFSFVTVVFIHLTLIAAVRALSRSKYIIYGTTFLFILAPFFNTSTYSRFYASLPNEFAIAFVLPAMYCLFEYYRLKRREYDKRIQEREAIRKEEIDRIIHGQELQEFRLAASVMPKASGDSAEAADDTGTIETTGTTGTIDNIDTTNTIDNIDTADTIANAGATDTTDITDIADTIDTIDNSDATDTTETPEAFVSYDLPEKYEARPVALAVEDGTTVNVIYKTRSRAHKPGIKQVVKLPYEPTPFERMLDKIKSFMSVDYEDYDDLDFLEGYYDEPEKSVKSIVSNVKHLKDGSAPAKEKTAHRASDARDAVRHRRSIFDPIRAFLKRIHFLENRDAIIAIITLSMAVSLTVAIHFYAAMIVCICCFIIFVVFTLFVTDLRCGIRVLASGIIGIFAGFFPMIVAVMMGYTLHGSLYWGLSIIRNTIRFYNNTTGTYEASAWDYTDKTPYYNLDIPYPEDYPLGDYALAGNTAPISVDQDYYDFDGLDIPGMVERAREEVRDEMRINREKQAFVFSDTVLASQSPVIRGSADNTSIIQRVIARITYWTDRIWGNWKSGWVVTTASVPFLTYDSNNFPLYSYFHNVYSILAGLGILYVFLKRRFYGGLLLSSAASISAVFMLPTLGFFYNMPLIMDGTRALEFHAYLVPFVTALLLDGILTLPSLFVKRERRKKVLSFAVYIASLAFVGLCLFYTLILGNLRIPLDSSRDRLPTMQERNEAVASISSIINTENDYTYTVVSANDERGMLWDHGFHVELAEFLWGMEGLGNAGKVQIPTPTVFFFVEKRPISYGISYEGLGNLVSRDGAENPLPDLGDDLMYGGYSRYILMSRMYYWCKAFQKLYPGEMKVYYETDDFVCYRLEQNPYRLLNFALDYDFNMREWRQAIDPSTGLPLDGSNGEPTGQGAR